MSPGGIPLRQCSTATKRYFAGGHPPLAIDQMIFRRGPLHAGHRPTSLAQPYWHPALTRNQPPSTSGVIIPAAPPKPNNRACAASPDPGAMGESVGRGPDAREAVTGDGCLRKRMPPRFSDGRSWREAVSPLRPEAPPRCPIGSSSAMPRSRWRAPPWREPYLAMACSATLPAIQRQITD